MRLRMRVVLVVMFGALVPLIGCDSNFPKMITRPDTDDLVTARIGRITIKIDGRTTANILYEFGSVLIHYETETRWKAGLTNRPPAAAVRDFFAEKGYTATVSGYIGSHEIVSIDSDVDLYLMLDDLRDLPGVADARLHFIHKTSELLSDLDGVVDEVIVVDDEESISISSAIIEVGMLEDGSLYEFGTVLVRHDDQYTAAAAVDAFFQERGYVPTVTDFVFGYTVIHVGDRVDTAPMLESLRAIPGVEDALLNQLHPIFEISMSESAVPGVSLF